MDLHIAINSLLPGAKYRLSSSVPPHTIVEWRDEREQPEGEALEEAWENYVKETAEAEALKGSIIDSITIEGGAFLAVIASETGEKQLVTIHCKGGLNA